VSTLYTVVGEAVFWLIVTVAPLALLVRCLTCGMEKRLPPPPASRPPMLAPPAPRAPSRRGDAEAARCEAALIDEQWKCLADMPAKDWPRGGEAA
jgi:hypothetical protein